MRRTRHVRCMVTVLALAVLGLLQASTLLYDSTISNHSLNESTDGLASSTSAPLRILCYGDSLTLGLSPPIHVDASSYCPYSDSLQIALEEMLGPQQSIQVNHVGLSGWTSSQFLKHARHAERGLVVHAADADITILLIGTNDIGRVLRNTQDNVEKAANFISRNLWTLQESALQAGARLVFTVAIPNSRYHQQQSKTALLVQQVNRKLEERSWGHNQTNYVEFPVDPLEKRYWSSDALHLSCQGYEKLGKALAGVVGNVLTGRAAM